MRCGLTTKFSSLKFWKYNRGEKITIVCRNFEVEKEISFGFKLAKLHFARGGRLAPELFAPSVLASTSSRSANSAHTATLRFAQIVLFGNDFACPRPLGEMPTTKSDEETRYEQ